MPPTFQANPFSGAPGARPPFLAGRDWHVARLDRALARFSAFDPRTASYEWPVLIGPRGTGKTVLLNHFRQRIADVSPNACIHLGTPATDSDIATIIGRVERFCGLLPDPARALQNRLIACCERAPVALLTDEAHMLTPDALREMLNVAQIVCAQAPLLIALAGTPHLATVLDASGASFNERCQFVGVGRLARADAAHAIAVPFAARRPAFRLEPDVLDAVAEETGGYPFFVSIWGEELWEALAGTGEQTADAAIFQRAKQEVEARRRGFTGRRFDELDRLGVLGTAAAVADAFADAAHLESRDVRAIIAHARPVDANARDDEQIFNTLVELGYIWRPPLSEHFEPGIPSLMAYVQDRTTPGPTGVPSRH